MSSLREKMVKQDMSERVQQLGSMLSDGANMVKLYPVLKEVTSSVDQPPPGYLYQILIDFSYKGPKNAELLGDYLTRRLNRQNPCGVLKTLKTIEKISLKGSRNFRAYLRSHDDNLRNLRSRMPSRNTGLSSEKEGRWKEDIVCLADNILTHLFNQHNIDRDSSVESETLPGEMKMSAMGSTGSSSSQGFGNTSSVGSGSATLASSLLNVVDKIVSAPDPKLERLAACLQPSPVGSYTPAAKVNVYDDMSSDFAVPTTNRKYIQGRAGGGWESDQEESEDDLSQFCRMYENVGGNSNTDNYQLISECAEFTLISQFCCRNTLTEEKRHNFIDFDKLQELMDACSSGSKTNILHSLQYLLATESDVALLRCLCVIERVIQSWLVNATAILAALRVNLESRRLDSDTRVAVKSSKILSTLEFLKNYKS